MKVASITRSSILAALAVSLWVGALGMDRLYSSTPHPSGVALGVAACEEELQRRLPPGPPVSVSADYQVKNIGDSGMRILGRFEGRGSATPFACDVRQAGGSWEVTEITVVRF